ncbi:hypothetical protein F383_01244 [Gossypium arboreum]|uniref:Uncharacterized protein n=1 Tax=Gossypium arboreum TaxID=29729 RepID=A0A0B0PNC7_GOSAR|nr:hypothetical protein F383_01244 [Gossypium arboreum]
MFEPVKMAQALWSTRVRRSRPC